MRSLVVMAGCEYIAKKIFLTSNAYNSVFSVVTLSGTAAMTRLISTGGKLTCSVVNYL